MPLAECGLGHPRGQILELLLVVAAALSRSVEKHDERIQPALLGGSAARAAGSETRPPGPASVTARLHAAHADDRDPMLSPRPGRRSRASRGAASPSGRKAQAPLGSPRNSSRSNHCGTSAASLPTAVPRRSSEPRFLSSLSCTRPSSVSEPPARSSTARSLSEAARKPSRIANTSSAAGPWQPHGHELVGDVAEVFAEDSSRASRPPPSPPRHRARSSRSRPPAAGRRPRSSRPATRACPP